MDNAEGERFIKLVTEWARRERNVSAAILVGSYARGAARPDSDVDIVLLCRVPAMFLESTYWIERLGEIGSLVKKRFKTLSTFEVSFLTGLKAELGVAGRSWDLAQHDPEVQGVLGKGAKSLYDSRHLRVAL